MAFNPNKNEVVANDEKAQHEQKRKELRQKEYDNTIYYCTTLGKKNKDEDKQISTHFSNKSGKNPAFFINFEPKRMQDMKTKVTNYLSQEDERYVILQDLLITFNEKVTDYNNQSVVIYINENDPVKIYELKRGLIATLLKGTSINTSYETIILRRDLLEEMSEEEDDIIDMNQ